MGAGVDGPYAPDWYGPGWYGVWTLWGVAPDWSTGGKTVAPTPEPLFAGLPPPATITGAPAVPLAASTRAISSCIAVALGKRSFGFFFSARATSASIAGVIDRLMVEGTTGSSWTCAYAMASGESASKGIRPVSSWKSMMPTEYRSERASTLRPRACSGRGTAGCRRPCRSASST